MIWANFLHIYQPPTQYPEVVKQIAEESYEKLVAILEQNQRAKVTLNINASLTEQLANLGFESLIRRIAVLAHNGQIEFTGSAAYHALLPKLPDAEIGRQITRNMEINQKYFGQSYQPQGFFPPEMAYADNVGRIVASSGFKWIIVSEYAPPPAMRNYQRNHTFKITGLPLVGIARDKKLSLDVAFNTVLSADQFEKFIRNQYGDAGCVVTAMDGETFGHHNRGQARVLESIYQQVQDVRTVTLSEYLLLNPPSQEIPLEASSWGMTDDTVGLPYPLWDDPHNPVQPLQWRLTQLALVTDIKDSQVSHARELLDKALHSDQYWWASGKPYWRLDMIEKGAAMLRDAIATAADVSEEDKSMAQSLYDDIIRTAIAFKGQTAYDIPKI